MPRLAVLYSGGRDSTLAACLLDPFYDIQLVTATFGITEAHEYAAEAAQAVAYPHTVYHADRAVAETACDRLLQDGYPRNAIQFLHEQTLEAVAAEYDVDAIADGTRRDDRTPTVDRPTAQSLEDRYAVDYLAPLQGIGHGAVAEMAADCLAVHSGPSESIPSADYERALRALLRERDRAVEEYFPAHEQSRVEGRK